MPPSLKIVSVLFTAYLYKLLAGYFPYPRYILYYIYNVCIVYIVNDFISIQSKMYTIFFWAIINGYETLFFLNF